MGIHKPSDFKTEDTKYILSSKLTEEGFGHAKLRKYYDEAEKIGRLKSNSSEIGKHRRDLKEKGISILSFWEEGYPLGFENLSAKPLLLYCSGEKKLLKRPMITLVGTRKSTYYGLKVIDLILSEISGNESFRDIVVVSGLAYGIDGAVHRKTMANGLRGIGVVAGGMGSGFPEINRSLYNQMCQRELVIAEFPPGIGIKKGMFPMRNRLLAALSETTVVVESPVKSGSLITAQYALDMGRNVYSVPGSIFSPTLKGNNQIISTGAGVLTNRMDVVDMLNELLESYRSKGGKA